MLICLFLAIGLVTRRRWGYKLALGYAGLAMTWGLLEAVVPLPTVPQMYIYAKDWTSLAFILVKGFVLYGIVFLYLLRPGVKAQFQKHR